MPRIFAVHEGAAIQIGHYGVATVDRAAVVPVDVAGEFKGRKDLRIELDAPAVVQQSAKPAAEPVKGKG